MTSTKKIVISISTVIAIAVIVVSIITIDLNTSNRYTQKMNQADELVVSGNYNEALTVYGQVLKLRSNSEIQTKIDKTVILKKSADAFNTGMNDFNVQNYEIAFSHFKSVIKEDSKNYIVALDKIKQCIELGDDLAIRKAKVCASYDAYETAINIVDKALGMDGGNVKLIDLKSKYTNAKSVADVKEAKQEAIAQSNAQLQEKAKEPTIGMTVDEVIATTWGRPDSINKTTTVDGTTEQWVYDYRYLYFDNNGILITIQN